MTSKWRDAIPRETGANRTAFRGTWNASLDDTDDKRPQYLPRPEPKAVPTRRKPQSMLEIAKNMKPANIDHIKKMDDRTEYLTKQAIRDNVPDAAIKPKYERPEMISAPMDLGRMKMDIKSVEPMKFPMLNEPVQLPKEEKKKDERPEMMSVDIPDMYTREGVQENKKKLLKPMEMKHTMIAPNSPSPLRSESIPMMADSGDLYNALARDKQKKTDLIVQLKEAENERLRRELQKASVFQRSMMQPPPAKQKPATTAIGRPQPEEQPSTTTNNNNNDNRLAGQVTRSATDDEDDERGQVTNTEPAKSGNRFFSRPKFSNPFRSSKPKPTNNPPEQPINRKEQPAKKKPSSRLMANNPLINGAKKIYSGGKKAKQTIKDEMKSLGTDLYGEEDTDTPAIRASLCLFNCMFMVMMFAFILTSFFLFGSYPVLVPDTFNTIALSASLLWLRLWWLKGSVITIMVMGAAVWSFALNMFTFQLMHPVSYTMVTSDTLVLTPTLNRTILNFTHVVDVSPSWWDAATWLHVVAMINETVTVMFLFLMSICQLNEARVSAAKRRRQRRLGVAGEVAEQEVVCIKIVGKCTRCEYCTCSSWICCRTRSKVTDNQWSDSLVTMMRVVAGAIWGLILSSMALSMASALEHIPAWTTLESPHFFLVIGLVCWCTPPIGETYWYAPRQTNPTVVWAPRFVAGGLFLGFGLVLSTWALIMERQRVEWTTGAVWLNRDSYTAKLNGAASVELYGGYTYSTTSSLDKTKLRDYALGHHVIELLLVILTYILWVMGTLVFILDSSAILPDPSITGGLMDDDDVEQQLSDTDCHCGDSDCDDDQVRVRVSVTA